MLPEEVDIPDVPVCERGAIPPEEVDIPDVPDIEDVPLVPDIDDIPLVPVCELDIVDPVVCERGIVLLPLWVGMVVVWPATVQATPIARARPKMVCLIIM